MFRAQLLITTCIDRQPACDCVVGQSLAQVNRYMVLLDSTEDLERKREEMNTSYFSLHPVDGMHVIKKMPPNQEYYGPS